MRLSGIIPLLWVMVVAACGKQEAAPPTDLHAAGHTEAAVFYTSLDDSLPQKAITALQLGRVTGVEFKELNGRTVSYFQYHADRHQLLTVISQLPFSKYGVVSDTLCRKVDHDYYTKLQSQTTGTEQDQPLWQIDPRQFDIYECIKSPKRHLLLISRSSDLVYHRIERL